MASVEKWKANREKVAHARSFQGQLSSWKDAQGKRLKTVLAVEGYPVFVMIFDDQTFFVASGTEPEPAQILAALAAARPLLGATYPKAYKELDDRIQTDKELTRKARLDNILGAIRNNLPQIPELPGELEKLLGEIRGRRTTRSRNRSRRP